ncbi:MAG: diacylglycerol kinase family lipid kinase [Desulfobacterales bacterium]|nr:diacylglycerol kinase family lipid kinase [Desulfobacterales bacterium]
MTPKRVFIVNPNAGNGSTGLNWPHIRVLAKSSLAPFEYYITTGPGDAGCFAKEAIASGADQVVCVGGDGTLNEVLNGYMAHAESVRSGVRLGFIPNGTGCDFIKTVQIPGNIKQAVGVIAANNVCAVDVGRLHYKDHDGNTRCRYFHNISSFGLGGEVDQRVNRTAKPFGPFVSFIWATLVSIFQYGKKKVYLKIDDHFRQTCIVWNVAVSNGQYHGGGMWVAPDASVDDGLFHVTVIGDLSVPEVLLNLPRLYNGRILQVKNVFSVTGRKIEASSSQRVLLDIDGEQPGTLPVVIDLLPRALNLITPER